MIYVRLAVDAGVVEVPVAETADLEGEFLVLRDREGRIVARFPKLAVLAYSQRRDLLEDDRAVQGGK